MNPQSPVVLSIIDTLLTLTPAQNHNGVYDIRLIAYDDENPYEANTLSDTLIFNLEVIPVNDSPILINPLPDIQLLEGNFQDTLFFNLENVFKDVDYSIMSQDFLSYAISSDNEEYLSLEIIDNEIVATIQSSGSTEIFVTATDQYGEAVSDSFNLIIDDVLSSDISIWPDEFYLSNAYPNPFNPVTNFEIEIPEFSYIDINVYNISGRLIDRIFDGGLAKGKYKMSWDAKDFPSGIYFINLISHSSHKTSKVILLK